MGVIIEKSKKNHYKETLQSAYLWETYEEKFEDIKSILIWEKIAKSVYGRVIRRYKDRDIFMVRGFLHVEYNVRSEEIFL